MNWSLTICASVYRREFWRDLERGAARLPDHEAAFTEPLWAGYDGEDLQVALKKLVCRVEKWLNQHTVSLVTHLVVTVYSLEVS